MSRKTWPQELNFPRFNVKSHHVSVSLIKTHRDKNHRKYIFMLPAFWLSQMLFQ
jgi:hypothetical protein